MVKLTRPFTPDLVNLIARTSKGVSESSGGGDTIGGGGGGGVTLHGIVWDCAAGNSQIGPNALQLRYNIILFFDENGRIASYQIINIRLYQHYWNSAEIDDLQPID